MKEKLLISVISGTELKKKKQWILVKLRLHNTKSKTKYVNGGEKIAFQKETFIFEVNEDVYPAGTLEIKVKTWEMLSSGEAFAFASVPLAPITAAMRESREFTNSLNQSTGSSIIVEEGVRDQDKQHAMTTRTVALVSKRGEEMKGAALMLHFELIPELDNTTMKSLPLMFRWFPELPHSEKVISECYCAKQPKSMVGMSHNGTMYITQNYVCFKSPSHLAKNKKNMISFREIRSIKKKMGSFYLPNAIQIRTAKKKYVFASFIHRSKAYRVLSNQWSLCGGSNSMNDVEEDDDDQEDELDDDDTMTYNDDQEDEEELAIINSSLNPTIEGLQTNIRPLSPLSKASLSTSGTRKARSLSIGKQQPLPVFSASTTPPVAATPPLAPVNENIKLVIEIEDYEHIGCANIFTITVGRDSIVKDLLDKVRSKIFSSSVPIQEQTQYMLMKSKTKRSKRSSQRLYPLPLDQILSNPDSFDNPMSWIPTKDFLLLHKSSSKSNNALLTTSSTFLTFGGASVKRFYVLESDKLISTYISSTQDILYLKKMVQSKEINVNFELVDENFKSFNINLPTNSLISDLYKEVSKHLLKRILPEEYNLYIPKNGERGIILSIDKPLDYYKIKPKCTIQIIKIPPFKSFMDKFKYFENSKNEKPLLFELVQTCFTNPLPSMKPDIDNPQFFLDKLQEKLVLDDTDVRLITKNLLFHSSFKDYSILIELKSRLEGLLLDSNKYYNTVSFLNNPVIYENWKTTEIHNISHLMKSVIFKEDCFVGDLHVHVIEGEGLGKGFEQCNAYVILSCRDDKRWKTTTIEDNTDPIWDESFVLKVNKPRAKLEMVIMNSKSAKEQEILGKIEINLKELEDLAPNTVKDAWFHLPTRGKIHLSLEYQYQFQEFNSYLNAVPERIETFKHFDHSNTDPLNDPNSSINNQHRLSIIHYPLYKTLLLFILDKQLASAPISPKLLAKQLKRMESDRSLNVDQQQDPDWIKPSYRLLLEQYRVRFGLGIITTSLIQLEIMIERYISELSPSLSNSAMTGVKNPDFIFELEEILTNIWTNTYEKKEVTEILITTTEIEGLCLALDKLLPLVQSTIGRYYESFPNNKPKGCLKSLVKVFETIIAIQNHLKNVDDLSYEQLLVQCVGRESKKKFDENVTAMGFLQLDIVSKKKQVAEITQMLIELISVIQEEINNTIPYETAFPDSVNITFTVIEVWGQCISLVIEDFCSWAPYHPQILVLVKHLLNYHNATKSICGDKLKPLPLKQLFITYVYKLLKEIKSNLNQLAVTSLAKDDKKTLASITGGYSSSFVVFFEACEGYCKDFDSLLWLPDSFSYVQLLEVFTSEIINFIKKLEEEIYHFISHTEIESPGKPTMFTLNIEPCIMMNNIDCSKTKLEMIANRIQKNLTNHLKSVDNNLDSTSKNCVETSFQMCLDDSYKTMNQILLSIDDFIISRMINNIIYCFESVLFTSPLNTKNSHYTASDLTSPLLAVNSVSTTPLVVGSNPLAHDQLQQLQQQQQPNLTSSTSSSGSSTPNPIQVATTTPSIVSIQASQSSSTSSLLSESGATGTLSARALLKYEKMILSQIKETISPKIEELYGKIKEPLFKPFLKKLWTLLIEEFQYLFIERPKDKLKLFHYNKVILNFDQIALFNSALKELMVLFHRGGSGIATPILEEKSLPIRMVVSLSEMDTTTLIDHYNQKRSVKQSHFNPPKDMIKAILATRFEFDKEARNFVNKANGVIEKPLVVDGIVVDEKVINVIPETEFIIDRYHCSYNGLFGILVISSRYLGFHSLLREVGVTLGHKISLPLTNIEEIKKTKVALLFNAIQIKSKENKIYTFSSFFDRDSVFNDIIHQMKVAQKKEKTNVVK
ncbi:hypothetical protein CYY_002607 [Polysphondylium violaceum]|uniref:C2 domain-containing protein n=1 Tax=Polysphondylium violaceum TaxID=133409 RepID=A0A8J4V289_9MYCE|nr:hypothetical protein CYY_002607 [Polysphondylium violaceum]